MGIKHTIYCSVFMFTLLSTVDNTDSIFHAKESDVLKYKIKKENEMVVLI